MPDRYQCGPSSSASRKREIHGFTSKKPRGGPASLLLKGIPSSWDWKYVKDLCHNKDPTVYLPGRTPAPRRGRVTVEFATREQAEAAAARINGDLPSVVPTAGITAEVV